MLPLIIAGATYLGVLYAVFRGIEGVNVVATGVVVEGQFPLHFPLDLGNRQTLEPY